MCVFLGRCLPKEHLYLWERYGWEHSVELAEIFESESENGFHVGLISSLTICVQCG